MLVPKLQLIPAIDLLDGRCVRLLHGDFEQVTQYPYQPAELAQSYHAAGASWLHVVDLAASRDGAGADTTALFKLLAQAPQAVQTGGGVRDDADIEKRLDAGAARVVVGSLSVTDRQRFTGWLQQYGAGKLVAALDVLVDEQGTPWPRTHGWTAGSGSNLWQVLDELAAGGLRHLLCTDISRDGALTGPNIRLYGEVTRRYPQLQLQASGGVSSLADLDRLKRTAATGVITGKALLDGKFSVAEALETLQ